MKWYFKILGGHTHVSVFMNGGKCGDLVFRNEEFEQIKRDNYFCSGGAKMLIDFIDETQADL